MNIFYFAPKSTLKPNIRENPGLTGKLYFSSLGGRSEHVVNLKYSAP